MAMARRLRCQPSGPTGAGFCVVPRWRPRGLFTSGASAASSRGYLASRPRGPRTAAQRSQMPYQQPDLRARERLTECRHHDAPSDGVPASMDRVEEPVVAACRHLHRIGVRRGTYRKKACVRSVTQPTLTMTGDAVTRVQCRAGERGRRPRPSWRRCGRGEGKVALHRIDREICDEEFPGRHWHRNARHRSASNHLGWIGDHSADVGRRATRCDVRQIWSDAPPGSTHDVAAETRQSLAQ